jgi:hypothetical protein
MFWLPQGAIILEDTSSILSCQEMDSWWYLHILLNQVAALAFKGFFLMFLKLQTVFACWVFII